jgi:2-aminoadipate transaminase
MKIDPKNYLTGVAREGTPSFFPDPSAPITFNFDQGLAAQETFPLDDLAQLHKEILDRDGGRALEYISMDYDENARKLVYIASYAELALGYTELRDELSKWLNTHNARSDLDASNIIVTTGSSQAIGLAANAIVEAGDGVLVEAVTFPWALRDFEMRGADVRAVALDSDGMDPDSLEHELEALRKDGIRPKLLYIVATFQLPTGVCTSLDRRRRILELAEKYDFLVLEDNIYGDLRYSGEPIPTLLSLDQSNRVLQSHAFSKTIAPGLRLGWITASEGLIGGLAAVRQDLGPSQWTCRVMAEYLKRGLLDRHVEEVIPLYRRRRDVAAAAVREHCFPWVTFELPDGGFYLWLTLSEDVDWEKARLAAEAAGVAFRPGERFMADKNASRRAFLRLAFSHVGDEELRRGIEVLGKAINDAVVNA